MNIKQIKTEKFEGLAVLVPDKAFRFYIYEADWMQEETSVCYSLPPDERDTIFLKDNSDDYEIIGKATELTEEQCAEIAVRMQDSGYPFEIEDYKVTFENLMHSLGCDLNLTWLIIKKLNN